jgi:cytochrome c2
MPASTDLAGRMGRTFLALALTLLIPAAWSGFRSGFPAWHPVEQDHLWIILTGGICLLITAALLSWRTRHGAGSSAGAWGYVAIALILLLLVALLSGHYVRRSILVLTAAALVAGLLVIYRAPGSSWLTSSCMGLVVFALAAYQLKLGIADPYRQTTKVRSSSLYRLEFTTHSGFISPPTRPGGGITQLGPDILLATGAGQLFLLHQPPGGRRLVSKPLALRVPINAKEFSAAVTKLDIASETFRVTDIHAELENESLGIFATHLYWLADRSCFVMRVSHLATRLELLDGLGPETPWRTVFESSPCLTVTDASESIEELFEGNESGGRMARLNADTLLVTMGDFRFNGIERRAAQSQDPASSYGKIIAIDTRDWSARLYSVGHRNPQGLYVDSAGLTWATEHGPRGGDELNRVEEGGNYGWPLVTYGTQYAEFEWSPNLRQGAHEGFDKPLFAWVPSIGVSGLVRSSSGAFRRWNGDLIVAALKDEALWRVRLEGDRAVVTERIDIGHRIRDLLEVPSGELLLWSDSGLLIFVAPAGESGSFGSSLADCMGCHPAQDGASHGLGPNLWKVAGSRIASASGYRYSKALAEIGGRWTSKRLDRFLQDPRAFAPGTSMNVPGIDDAATRKALIEELQALR